VLLLHGLPLGRVLLLLMLLLLLLPQPPHHVLPEARQRLRRHGHLLLLLPQPLRAVRPAQPCGEILGFRRKVVVSQRLTEQSTRGQQQQ
jgi:hypothetical protein